MTNATCNSCGAPIRWVITMTGKQMPLDPEPHPQGNVTPLMTDDGPRALVHPGPVDFEPAWLSHFVTCPSANQHRKGKP